MPSKLQKLMFQSCFTELNEHVQINMKKTPKKFHLGLGMVSSFIKRFVVYILKQKCVLYSSSGPACQ